MIVKESTLTTKTVFSDDGRKLYLLQKSWNPELPKLCVIMLCAGNATECVLDPTNMYTTNNSVALGFGSVDALNLFSTIGDYSLKQSEAEDTENMDFILASAEQADSIVFCPGVGKSKNKAFIQRSKQVLEALRPYESKLYCLTDKDGNARLQHPLSPAVRTWHLSPLKVSELLPPMEEAQPVQKKTPKGKSKASTKQE